MNKLESRLIMGALLVCSWLMIAGIVLSPSGRTFYYDYRDSDLTHRIIAKKLAPLPAPVFISERYANLPWIQTHAPHFVRGHAYESDRQAGIPYEGRGWEGLVNAGYFATVVMAAGDPVPQGLEQKYDLVDEYKTDWVDYKFYRRKP